MRGKLVGTGGGGGEALPLRARRKLVVHLKGAAADKGGTSDPYVKLDSRASRPSTPQDPHGAEKRSKVVKGSPAPVWDETFEFAGTRGRSADAQTVHDHDGISFDDSLGEAKLPLAALAVGYAEELTLPLEGKKATRLRIGFLWVRSRGGGGGGARGRGGGAGGGGGGAGGGSAALLRAPDSSCSRTAVAT